MYICRNSLHYLDHNVSSQGVAPDPIKIQAIVDWPILTSQSELRGFLSLIGFYRKFIKGYAAMATPLTTLLWKDNFQWH